MKVTTALTCIVGAWTLGLLIGVAVKEPTRSPVIKIEPTYIPSCSWRG